MSRAEELWERLVRAALRRERTGEDAYGQPVGGIAGNVPSGLAKNRDIDEILRVVDEIQDDDPICEHAYSLSQNLDPNSEDRGVLQFKTGLMSVIKGTRGRNMQNLPISKFKCKFSQDIYMGQTTEYCVDQEAESGNQAGLVVMIQELNGK
ncbi:hypothetical protein V8G54_015986 [Vigna mungo]|uniref:Uncharacterized protein n=1 Tax=Vigna mungo TaxID=3915 RepID=A0AAQ3NKC8_VIGMU